MAKFRLLQGNFKVAQRDGNDKGNTTDTTASSAQQPIDRLKHKLSDVSTIELSEQSETGNSQKKRKNNAELQSNIKRKLSRSSVKSAKQNELEIPSRKNTGMIYSAIQFNDDKTPQSASTQSAQPSGSKDTISTTSKHPSSVKTVGSDAIVIKKEKAHSHSPNMILKDDAVELVQAAGLPGIRFREKTSSPNRSSKFEKLEPAELAAICMWITFQSSTANLGQGNTLNESAIRSTFKSKVGKFVILYGSVSWTYSLMGVYVTQPHESKPDSNQVKPIRFIFMGDPAVKPNLETSVELVWHSGTSEGLWTLGPFSDPVYGKYWAYRQPRTKIKNEPDVWFECAIDPDTKTPFPPLGTCLWRSSDIKSISYDGDSFLDHNGKEQKALTSSHQQSISSYFDLVYNALK